MKTMYIIAVAVVVIIIIIGSVFAYTYIQSNSTPKPTPSPTPTATPAPTATSIPTVTPAPTSTTTPATPSPTPYNTPAPTYTPTPVATPTPVPTLTPTTLQGAGGTLVNPLMQVWIPAYSQAQPTIPVTYNAVGSGAGITQFQQTLIDFGESDVPLQAADITGLPSGTTALTIPISASAVVPAYNIKLNNGSYCQNGLNFTGSVLASIFLGTITTWNDPAIQALQSPSVAAQLPSATIITVHRSDSSGTMYAFTDYLSQSSTAWANGPGKGKLVNWPNPSGLAVGSKGNAAVAASIVQNVNSIGPLEIAYEIQLSGQISYGTVKNAAGNFVLGDVNTAQAALAAGASMLPAGNAMSSWSSVSIIDSIFNNATATNAYPITTMTYALAYQAQTSYTQGAALVNFLSWIVNNGQTFGPTTGYVALPASIVAIDNATIKLITYNGTPIQH